jgi:hypothetical protein
MMSGKKGLAARRREPGIGKNGSAGRKPAEGPGAKPRSPRKALWLLGGAVALLLIAWGCAYFGVFDGGGPRSLTIVYSCDANGELKPCG